VWTRTCLFSTAALFAEGIEEINQRADAGWDAVDTRVTTLGCPITGRFCPTNCPISRETEKTVIPQVVSEMQLAKNL
jgi:hypothetical protein